jgi:hypothetical protein
MPRYRIAFLAALCVLALAAPAAGGQESGRISASEMYWLGPHFAGLRLTETIGPTFFYGECIPPEGEFGCEQPAEVGNATSCTENPISSNDVAQDAFLVPGGGLAVAYGPGAVDVGTGLQTVSLRTGEPELLGAALRELRRRSEAGPQPLAPPVYPLPVLRELKRVTVAAERFNGVDAIAEETEVSPEQVELRLRVAELLGPAVLADVPAPTISVFTVERWRQLAAGVQAHNLRHTAERHKMSVASLKKKIRQVRGLAGGC